MVPVFIEIKAGVDLIYKEVFAESLIQNFKIPFNEIIRKLFDIVTE